MRILSRIILKLLGWKVIGTPPAEIKKYVMIVAPHTSNLDFVIGRLAFFQLGINVKFLIKKELFRFPLGGILKAIGGIPVNRGKKNNMVDYVADIFEHTDKLVVVITPEGTRKLNKNWKKGFYFISKKASIPIVMGFIDYKRKECGVGKTLSSENDINILFDEIRNFYSDKTACYPEKFSLSPMYRSLP